MPKVSLIAYEAQYNLWEYRNHLENGLQPRTVLIPWHFTSLDCLSIRFNEETTDHSSPLQRGTPYPVEDPTNLYSKVGLSVLAAVDLPAAVGLLAPVAASGFLLSRLVFALLVRLYFCRCADGFGSLAALSIVGRCYYQITHTYL
ncbi:hypothetical protein IG631_16649 [Alternaria alternata]|nr:hypothetical protein IG631_16649 [Alternaria alternata]